MKVVLPTDLYNQHPKHACRLNYSPPPCFSSSRARDHSKPNLDQVMHAGITSDAPAKPDNEFRLFTIIFVPSISR